MDFSLPDRCLSLSTSVGSEPKLKFVRRERSLLFSDARSLLFVRSVRSLAHAAYCFPTQRERESDDHDERAGNGINPSVILFFHRKKLFYVICNL